MYSVDQKGQKAVGIGSVDGSSDISVTDSKFDFISRASNCIAMGSYSADTNISLNHIFFTAKLEGNRLAAIGTLDGDLATVYITKSNVTCMAFGRECTGIGVCGNGDSVFTVDNAALALTVKGKKAAGIGTWDQNGSLKATNARLAVTVMNEEETFIGSKGDNIDISNCDVKFEHNDKTYLMPDLMRLIHSTAC